MIVDVGKLDIDLKGYFSLFFDNVRSNNFDAKLSG